MKIELHVISGRTYDTAPSILFVLNKNSYLVNIPDQTQRVFMQHRIKMSSINHVFLLDNDNTSIGGLIGMYLTALENNRLSFTIPKEYVDSIHAFEFHSIDVTDSYSDKFITSKYIKLEKSYLLDLKFLDLNGKFLPEKAKKLGLSPSPLYRKLVAGETITLENGTVIKPEDCMEHMIKGERILIINCKCLEDIDKIPNLDEYSFFIHFTEVSILESKEYLDKFSFNDRINLCFMPSGRIMFSDANDFYQKLTGKTVSYDYTEVIPPKNFVNCFTGLSYVFAPVNKKRFDRFLPELDILSSSVENSLPIFSTFAVTHVGTGCKLPSKIRNTLGILIHYKEGFIVLDVGEGFLGQLRRIYGIKNAEYILINTKCVWFSHFHGDHVIGLYQFLQERSKVTSKIIPVCGDQNVLDSIKMQEILSKQSFYVKWLNRSIDYIEGDGFSIKSIPVDHCEDSNGCLLTLENQWKIAYSGDKSTEDNFNKSINGCDLLIHESTYSDDLVENAKENKHSILRDAINASKEIGAKYSVFLHNSPRFNTEYYQLNYPNIFFAFDYLSYTYENINEAIECSRNIYELLKSETPIE